LFATSGIESSQIQKKCDCKYGLNSEVPENALETPWELAEKIKQQKMR